MMRPCPVRARSSELYLRAQVVRVELWVHRCALKFRRAIRAFIIMFLSLCRLMYKRTSRFLPTQEAKNKNVSHFNFNITACLLCQNKGFGAHVIGYALLIVIFLFVFVLNSHIV